MQQKSNYQAISVITDIKERKLNQEQQTAY